tara:strand:- start:8602 stop:9057 length:456 start_codon:yes stop_codon:yes gene_type:complete
MIKNLKTEEGIRLLSDNYIGRLAFICQGNPYVVPITYYYDETSNSILGYSAEGHKMNAMRKNRSVSLEVDEITAVNNWQSILAHGIFEELQGSEAKFLLHRFAQGVKNIIIRKEKIIPQSINAFSSKMNSPETPIVFRIKIVEITGKQRKP